jgi:hypothetical protein
MKNFVITITETLKKNIVVPAETSEEAIERIEKLYEAGDIILDERAYYDCEIEDRTELLGGFVEDYPRIDCYEIKDEEGD